LTVMAITCQIQRICQALNLFFVESSGKPCISIPRQLI
jgi:hypothetical protein